MWGAENYTYTEDAQGLVAWLNEKIANSSFRAVHITLPTGNVSRGTANLIGLPTGLNLVIQGQGMSGATTTTLNLQQKNLDIGAMLGDTGRIEFRNMGITNVRAAASAPPQLLPQSLLRLCRAILPRYACTTPCRRMLADSLCLFPGAIGSCVEGTAVALWRAEVTSLRRGVAALSMCVLRAAAEPAMAGVAVSRAFIAAAFLAR